MRPFDRSSPSSLVGHKLIVITRTGRTAFTFYVARYDRHRRLYTMRDTSTRREHGIRASELFGYLEDSSLRSNLRIVED